MPTVTLPGGLRTDDAFAVISGAVPPGRLPKPVVTACIVDVTVVPC